MTSTFNPTWKAVYTLNEQRQCVAGSTQAMADAIRRGCGLRVFTAFRHNEHIEVGSPNAELIREGMEFQVTYLLDDRWVAGVMTTRQPVSLPASFGQPPSMSLFLYNQNGDQAVGRLRLDGQEAARRSPVSFDFPGMTRMHLSSALDADTTGPASNFVYEFDHYRFCVADCWTEVFAHDEQGKPQSGSYKALDEAFMAGAEIKVSVAGLCASMGGPHSHLRHEIFVGTHSCYHYTVNGPLIAGTHPIVRVRPAIPLRYESHGWDFGWLVVRTDGAVVYRRLDPYTSQWTDEKLRCAVRWFVR